MENNRNKIKKNIIYLQDIIRMEPLKITLLSKIYWILYTNFLMTIPFDIVGIVI